MSQKSEIKSIGVFCGASSKVERKFIDVAVECGERIAKEGLKLTYGGGDCGLMGAVSAAAKHKGAKVLGISTRLVSDREISHVGSEHTYITNSMFERKKDLFINSDAFICLPGGFGTLDEIFEVITLSYLDEKEMVGDKPIIIVNFDDYWQPLINMMKYIVENKFASTDTEKNYHVVQNVDDAFKLLGF